MMKAQWTPTFLFPGGHLRLSKATDFAFPSIPMLVVTSPAQNQGAKPPDSRVEGTTLNRNFTTIAGDRRFVLAKGGTERVGLSICIGDEI